MTDKDAIRQVLGALTSQSRVRLLDPAKGVHGDLATLVVEAFNVQRQAMLHEAEAEKTHPLEAFRMSAPDFTALCDYLVDGGGVTDDMTASLGDQGLTLILWQAIHDRNQGVFWKELPHLVKTWMKQRELIQQLPGGGTVAKGAISAVPNVQQTVDGPGPPAHEPKGNPAARL